LKIGEFIFASEDVDYNDNFMNKRVFSNEHRKKISLALTGRNKPEDVKQKLSKSLIKYFIDYPEARILSGSSMRGKHHSAATKKKISDGNKGKKITKRSIEKRIETRRKRFNGKYFSDRGYKNMYNSKRSEKILKSRRNNGLPWHSKKSTEKMSKSHKKRLKNPKYRVKISKLVKKTWKNYTKDQKHDRLAKMIRSSGKRPNKCEIVVNTILNNLYPGEYKYVGDGKVWIGNANPDFMNVNGQKKVIEFFGEFYHKSSDEELRRCLFEKYGFKCLVIWGKDLRSNNKLRNKIIKFHIA